MVNIIVVTHGDFGAYLVEAAEGIVGPQGGGVRCVGISSRVSVPEVRARLSEAVKALNGGEGLVLVTDMAGGTPSNIALPLVKDLSRVVVVSGVNLYMLIAAFNHRRSVGVEELAEKMISAGKRSVTNIKNALAAQG